MSWLFKLVPSPEDRHPLTTSVFFADFLPVLLCYHATAVAVLLPNTFHARLALLPITLWSAFRAATTIDIAKASGQAGLIFLNYGLCLMMVTICMRVIDWTFRMKPFTRTEPLPPGQTIPSPKDLPVPSSEVSPGNLKNAFWNAFDLSYNLRGHGWSWCKGLRLPPETRPTQSTPAFALTVAISFVGHLFLLDALLYVIQSLSPSTFGSPSGGTIFLLTLSPPYRYIYSSFVSVLSCFVVYGAIHIGYDFVTLIGILLFRQYPTQWPPIFHEPWRSTSLSELWAKRWHQVFRQSFISMGGIPFSFLLGRAGGVMGVFLVSGLLHDLGMWGMGKGTEFTSITGFFLMMGVGLIMENIWKNITGQRVGGWFGWTWTMLWAIGWSNMLVDAWLRRGLAGSIFMPEAKRPFKLFVEYLYHSLPLGAY